jgi:hypothetical protein
MVLNTLMILNARFVEVKEINKTWLPQKLFVYLRYK